MDLEDPPNRARVRTLRAHPVVFPPEGGACKGKPTEWWFPEIAKGASDHDRQTVMNVVAHAKRICFQCPVRAECLDYSLNHEPFGVWGGFDERERLMIGIKQGIIPTRTRVGQKLPGIGLRRGPRTVTPDVPAH